MLLALDLNAAEKAPIDQVDPFIGTGFHGHTFPGAVFPHGMVQVSPDTRTAGWDACAGYHYDDNVILGFTQTHFSGTGCTDMGDFMLMPNIGTLDSLGWTEKNKPQFRSSFSHENEKASPGYYQVDLEDSKIKVELTATERVGFHRYTFPKSSDAHILLDLVHRIHGKRNISCSLSVVDDQLITGSRVTKGWAKHRQIYFAARFSKPFKHHTVVDDFKSQPQQSNYSAKHLRSVIFFDIKDNEQIQVKISISGVSEKNAMLNLDQECGHWDFDKVHSLARQKWSQELNKIIVEADESTRRSFYTSVYHAMIHPSVYSDVNGEYRGLDRKVHKTQDWENHSIFSLWDTFRALHPLYTLIKQDHVGDLVQSMMAHFDQNDKGMLPIWTFHHNETDQMIGYHSVPVIADAYLKGLTDVDPEKILSAFDSTATVRDYDGLGYYIDHGYIPQDKVREGTSMTIECAYDDWCIAKLAESLGHHKLAKRYFDRSQNFHHVFDVKTGFMRAKMSDGKWREPFIPYETHIHGLPRLPNGKLQRDYTEGNAWQWLWFVPHDIKSLISLLGGDEKFVAKLDALFGQESRSDKMQVKDVSGLVGEYAQGNEPSHHVAYLYNYAGQPWKSQKILHKIMREQYHDTPEGISGNEDCGQMSAWYIFSAMGFYPVNPCGGVYVIGSPLLEKSVMKVGDGKTFTVVAKNVSDKNIYIQSVKLNGKVHDKTWITHEDIVKGGVMDFTMGPKPNKAWGVSNNEIPFSSGT